MNEASARTLVEKRAKGRCEICGAAGYEYSHRRTRAVRDEHRWCPCNGMLACRTCHARCHANPAWARDRGFHVSRYQDLPWSVPVTLLSGQWMFRCDGSKQFLHDARIP